MSQSQDITQLNTSTATDSTPSTCPEGMKPRKAQSSYLQYINDPQVRDQLKETFKSAHEGKTIPPKMLVSKLADQWNALTPELKKPYQVKWEEEKKRLVDYPEYVPEKKKKHRPVNTPPTSNQESSQEMHKLLATQQLDIDLLKQQVSLLTQIVQQLQSSSSHLVENE